MTPATATECLLPSLGPRGATPGPSRSPRGWSVRSAPRQSRADHPESSPDFHMKLDTPLSASAATGWGEGGVWVGSVPRFDTSGWRLWLRSITFPHLLPFAANGGSSVLTGVNKEKPRRAWVSRRGSEEIRSLMLYPAELPAHGCGISMLHNCAVGLGRDCHRF